MTREHNENNNQEPTEAIFSVGSNCGDRVGNVAKALSWLSGLLTSFRHSPIYATPDCHGGQIEYMNAVGVGLATHTALELDRLCKEYEVSCGRDAEARASGDVPVDVDLVIYDGEVLRKKDYASEFFKEGYKELA